MDRETQVAGWVRQWRVGLWTDIEMWGMLTPDEWDRHIG